jgi:multimeric flavodoxin WrbA
VKVVGLSGSPRRGGNTETLIDHVLAGAAECGAETEKIILDEFLILPIRECTKCRVSGKCSQDDDVLKLLRQVLAADAIAFGTPLYWWGPSAQIKLFVDRWNCWLPEVKPGFAGKRAVLAVAQAGERKVARHLVGMFESITAHVGLEFGGSVHAIGGERGAAARDKPALMRAEALGRWLVTGSIDERQ